MCSRKRRKIERVTMNTRACFVPLILIAAASVQLPAQTPASRPPDAAGVFPREIDDRGFHIVVYQPQIDSWKKNHLEGRAALTFAAAGATNEMFGIVTLTARTDVDKETRTVWLEDLRISKVSFPGAESRQHDLEQAVRDSLVGWPRAISLDRVLADLSINNAETESPSAPLKTDPPRIIFSQVPSVLIVIDGESKMKAIPGNTQYTRVINTPALILFNISASQYYLDGNTFWMTASNINGPWSLASPAPMDLNALKTQLLQGEERDPHDHSKDANAPVAPPSAVFVSTTPAELIQTTGAPQFAPILKTELAYVANTSSNVFRDVKTQEYYVLLSGRWYQAKSTDGPWTWISGSQLPKDFTRIPPDHPKAAVLVSIPGTEQAKEAIIANQIPQTATIRRSEAKLAVTYDGPPQFQPMEGTSMEYAINTSFDVIHAGRYYAVRDGVWFVADAPLGPWAVADFIPAEIYTIPPSNPLYHDRFVTVYDSTPDFVYCGYTPGYLGAYVWDDTVVFGTGWWYPGWIGPGFWFGWPWTWGFGFDFGYFGGGWFWRPNGYWWYHNPGFGGRVYSDHWNPHWSPGDREGIHNNVNAYNRWGGNAVMSHAAVGAAASSRAGLRDIYAGRDGNVYERRNNTWTQRGNAGAPRRVQPTPDLQREQRSRSFGQIREGEFGGGGFSRGVPHSTFGGGGGGFRGGFGGGRR
jgi:hypothetical protein